MIYSINTFEKLLNICVSEQKNVYEIMQEKEAFEFETTIEYVRNKTLKIINAMKESINHGIQSKEKSFSGLCGDDCYKLEEKYKKNKAIFGHLFEKITTYALATMEENLRMNKIAACPTAGSCGIVPSVIIALSEEYKLKEEEEINALITAGTIGYVISSKVAMAGAVAGCQAECGIASAMSAGAAVYILGGNNYQIINAAALALKNILGLTCDSVAGLVEIPCVKRNVFLAIHSITAAELALAGIESKIPADEVVDAMVQTGQLMSPLLKETSQGGLAATKSGILINESLKSEKGNK
ncbi:MAG: L-serine ammonia-lyase, iron-sulfur-dependent, subunit alpha [Candidatus Gastranaerophilales bacterium]|nr:L-serine ammonia-lyase, iron-sulfur-dependent, subunit alpha [Candidatus Gastranaerophilales bacterium]